MSLFNRNSSAVSVLPREDSVVHVEPASPEQSELQNRAMRVREAKAEKSERVLFEKVALHRDKQAFSELYDRFSPKIYPMLLHMLRSEEDANDLLQEIFIIAWQKAPETMDVTNNPGGWLMQLAHNRAIDELRSKRYRERKTEMGVVFDSERPEIGAIADDRTADQGLHNADVTKQVRKALGELNEKDRSVVDLAYFHGMTHEQIAEKLDMPFGTVKTRLRRSMIHLNRILKPIF